MKLICYKYFDMFDLKHYESFTDLVMADHPAIISFDDKRRMHKIEFNLSYLLSNTKILTKYVKNSTTKEWFEFDGGYLSNQNMIIFLKSSFFVKKVFKIHNNCLDIKLEFKDCTVEISDLFVENQN